jgi:hypothetical protein
MVSIDGNINWQMLQISFDNRWSAAMLRQKWKALKQKVDGSEKMSPRGSSIHVWKHTRVMMSYGVSG